MRVKKVVLKGFKRFHHLTVDLGEQPKKVIALVGPNGSGKSSVFDAFERKASQVKGNKETIPNSFYSKKLFSLDIAEDFSLQNSIQIEYQNPQQQITKKSFLIRSAYRFTGRINVTSLSQKPDILNDELRPSTSIDMDSRLQDNYERLFSRFFSEVQSSELSGKALKEQILKEINDALSNVLDIKVTSLGNILESNEGKLFFEKGTSKNFPYDNLSSGEKEVLDLIIDLVVKSKVFNETVFCIDEPELHLNTAVQRKLLIEIAKLVPDSCQLWIATHSIGFLRALQDELANDCQILDFLSCDFDKAITVLPMKKTRSNWLRIFKTALEDLTGLVAPSHIIYCEGRIPPGENGEELGLDAQVYTSIFEAEFADTSFVSSGGATQPQQYSEFAVLVLGKVLNGITFFHLADRDIRHDGATMTAAEREQWLAAGANRKMLRRRELENYLYDFSVVQKAYPTISQEQYNGLVQDIENEDMKAKFADLRALCGETNISKIEFAKKLAASFSSDMPIYNELKNCIFNN